MCDETWFFYSIFFNFYSLFLKKRRFLFGMGAVGPGADPREKMHAVFADMKQRLDANRSSTQGQINATLNAFVAEVHSVYLETLGK
jgi:hypothetical protein